jgi:hypothetical protein
LLNSSEQREDLKVKLYLPLVFLKRGFCVSILKMMVFSILSIVMDLKQRWLLVQDHRAYKDRKVFRGNVAFREFKGYRGRRESEDYREQMES